MARGPLVTPSELETIARVYAETGNYTETARRCDRPESTVRKALQALAYPNRSELFLRACKRAEKTDRIARGVLPRQIERLHLLLKKDESGLSKKERIAPTERANLEGKLTAAVKLAAECADLHELRGLRRRMARLQRAKVRAETEVIAQKGGELPPLTKLRTMLNPRLLLSLLALFTDDELAEAQATLEGGRAPALPTEGGTAADAEPAKG